MAMMPTRSASGSAGQASITRAKSGPICVSRAKEWAKGKFASSVTTCWVWGLGQIGKGFESPWWYSLEDFFLSSENAEKLKVSLVFPRFPLPCDCVDSVSACLSESPEMADRGPRNGPREILPVLSLPLRITADEFARRIVVIFGIPWNW
jgi:hypothetical protein